MWQQIVFGVFLLAVAGGLSWHSRSLLLQEDRAKMTEEEHRIHRRRAWLRGVGSMLIGLIGVAMLTGLLVGDPRRVLFFWGGVLCLVLALVAIAGLDLLSTGQQVRLLRRRHRESQEQLRLDIAAEIARRKQSPDGST